MIYTPLDPEIFEWMAHKAFAEKGLVQEFDRLWGTSLSASKRRALSPIETMVDEAAGKREHDFMLFLDFVKEYIYDRLVRRGVRIYPGYA